jgi:hypothetical protein
MLQARLLLYFRPGEYLQHKVHKYTEYHRQLNEDGGVWCGSFLSIDKESV